MECKLLVALQLEVARHFIERFSGGRARRFESPATFGATKTPKTLLVDPYQPPAHGRLCRCVLASASEGKLKASQALPPLFTVAAPFDANGDAGTALESLADSFLGAMHRCGLLNYALSVQQVRSGFPLTILSAVIIRPCCIIGARLSPIQFVGVMDELDLFLQDRGSSFPRGLRGPSLIDNGSGS
jgi:hypothetical protein